MTHDPATAARFSLPCRPRHAPPMLDRSLSPPHVTEDEKPLQREVAMAYRTAREAGRSHEGALDAATAPSPSRGYRRPSGGIRTHQ